MIGGTVIEAIVLEGRVWINCEEDNSTSRCAIYVQRNTDSERIRPGDCVWWQGQSAMWTPYKKRGGVAGRPSHIDGSVCGRDYDILIPRIGFSGVSRPNSALCEKDSA